MKVEGFNRVDICRSKAFVESRVLQSSGHRRTISKVVGYQAFVNEIADVRIANAFTKSPRRFFGLTQSKLAFAAIYKLYKCVAAAVETGWRASRPGDEGTVRLSAKVESDRITEGRQLNLTPAIFCDSVTYVPGRSIHKAGILDPAYFVQKSSQKLDRIATVVKVHSDRRVRLSALVSRRKNARISRSTTASLTTALSTAESPQLEPSGHEPMPIPIVTLHVVLLLSRRPAFCAFTHAFFTSFCTLELLTSSS